MSGKSGMEERVQKILEERGKKVAEEAKRIMLEGVESKELQGPLQYVAEHWHDHLRPTLISLSCEAVEGRPETTTFAATAMTLLCSCINIYDNIIDRSRYKLFTPTLHGKFGTGPALIAGGLVTAKAFYNLYERAEREIPPAKRAAVNKLFHNFLLKMAEAEAASLNLRQKDHIDTIERFHVLQMHVADIEACMEIGATIGCGSELYIKRLGRYGLLLGTVINLREDLWDTLNLTVGLDEKIRTHALPYSLIWTVNQSERARNLLSSLAKKEKIEPPDVKEVVEVMFESGAIDYVKKLSTELTSEAINALARIKECEAKRSLKLIAKVQRSLLLKIYYPHEGNISQIL